MMRINDEIRKFLNNPIVQLEVDNKCDSSIMNSKKSISDMMLMSEYVDAMEVYVCDIVSEITRLNRDSAESVTTNNFGRASIDEIKRIIDSGKTPRIISIYKMFGFDGKEGSLIQRCLRNIYTEVQSDLIYCINSVDDEYPIDVNKLKLFGVDTRSMNIDYIFLNNESFDFRVDKVLGMKKYLVESLTALDYHNERMEALNASNTNRT